MAKTQHIDFEQSLIGVLMRNPETLTDCFIDPADFSQESHRVIFGAISEVSAKGHAVDIVTVSQCIENKFSAVDMAYITELATNTAGSKQNVGHYCRVIRQAARLRHALDIADSIRTQIELEDDEACDKVIDNAIQKLMSIDQKSVSHEIGINAALKNTLERLDYLHANPDILPGVTTGITALDKALGGFQAGRVYVFAGRPGKGKTALMMNLVNALTREKTPQGVFSAEMDHVQLCSRLISINGAINSYKMTTAKFDDQDWSKLTSAVTVLRDRELYINDQANIGIVPLMRQGRIWKKRRNIQAIFVDYIQILGSSSTKHNPTERVTDVMQNLKLLASELQVPVIGLAQLNRTADDLGRPAGMNHIADASAIEKDAHFIGTLYASEEHEQLNQMIIHVCKNRDGPKGDIPVNYQRSIYRVTDAGPQERVG